MSLKFKPEDFDPANTVFCYDPEKAAELAQAVYDKWLESQPVVHSHKNDSVWFQFPVSEEAHFKARLVAIEPIKKCQHTKVIPKPWASTVSCPDNQPGCLVHHQKVEYTYECCECGKKMKPSSWEPCE